MARGDISVLDAPAEPETGPISLPRQNALQDAIHTPWQAERDRAMEVLSAAPQRHLQRAALRMAGCGSHVDLYIDPDTAQVRRHTCTCKSRLCPYCARKRTARVADQMTAVVVKMKHPRHLVLTVKSQAGDLHQQTRDLRHWFAALRKNAFVKANMTAGVYTLECTLNLRTTKWHPHLHIIYDGEYMPQLKLRKLWHQITGGSDIVWITDAQSRTGLVKELCKYLGKPQDAQHWPDDRFLEYATAIHGVRMVQTFGKIAPDAVVDNLTDLVKPPNLWSISLAKICWLADQDDRNAAKLLPIIAQRWPDLARYLYQRSPQFAVDPTAAERLLRAFATIEAGPSPPKPPPKPPPTAAELEADMFPLLTALQPRAKEVMACVRA